MNIVVAIVASLVCVSGASVSRSNERNTEPVSRSDDLGPYNASFLADGIGLSRPLATNHPVLEANASWSLSGWLRPTLQRSGTAILAGIGDPKSPGNRCRCLVLEGGRLGLWLGDGTRLQSEAEVQIGHWQAIAATYDGRTAKLYLGGREVAAHAATTPRVAPFLHLAPDDASTAEYPHFGGSWASFALRASALSVSDVEKLARERPDFDLIVFHQVGVGWPLQQRAWRGLQEPQSPWTLPRAKTEASTPVAKPVSAADPLEAKSERVWTLNAWRMTEEGKVSTDGAALSQSNYEDDAWHVATVPGTVLTTLIDRGIYPDPDYGLNNMAIPERLARQKYWYRTRFEVPDNVSDRSFTLTFKGINYVAEVWLNGARIGDVTGAFTRGVFDITKQLKLGQPNALAVRVSPPPHPGIAHEESMTAGPGENGGSMALDGPTFIASEGWDWIPAMRDRNTGIWQEVELKATGRLRLLDPQVVTRLPLPKTDEADISIAVPVFNAAQAQVQATVQARFDAVSVAKTLTLQPGETVVRFQSSEFPQLRVRQPRLWWPNGYGPADLYTMRLEVGEAGAVSDSASLRFGVRHITYELSLFDQSGRLRRVEVDPTSASTRTQRLVDVRHGAIKKTPNGWAASLTVAGETSPAVRAVNTESLAPHLAIRVNGVPIAARGGNWGMDDARKRITRDRLEPYFKLHKAANLNTIRNWVGQNTEDVFYQLADEYGLLVLNDFWASTQNFQLEPQDPALFLANARDVIRRYRNHPSIALWFGRNEGVPQPVLNEGLDDLVAQLDGTRYFTGSSNSVNLQSSGPYNYRPPAQYFTELAQGFSVEVGTPSLSTLESLQASIPEADRWPISDALAYHDWHFGGNGDVASFMSSLATQFGPPTSLADFERKAQMMNYVTYRALFEGFHAGLWTKNSGRLLWMTHPSWPSNTWQIYSSDYDTHAAYYGVKKACEPLHAQMNLPDFRLAVVNTSPRSRRDLRLRTRIVSLDNRVLEDRVQRLMAPANATTTLETLALRRHLESEEVVLVVLALTDARGGLISDNVYWQGRAEESYRSLNTLAVQKVSVEIAPNERPGVVAIVLTNRGTQPALSAKLTMLDARGERVLPAYYSDNYLSLFPGESKTVEIQCPAGGARCASVSLRGWNIEPTKAALGRL